MYDMNVLIKGIRRCFV